LVAAATDVIITKVAVTAVKHHLDHTIMQTAVLAQTETGHIQADVADTVAVVT
jgi:hypothetical protein